MDERISIHLRGRGQNEAGVLGAGEAQGIVRSQSADLEDRDRDALEVHRARGRGEVVDLIQLPHDADVGRHVVVHVLEVRVSQVGHVLQGAGAEVVHADNFVALREQTLAQVAPYEAGPARDERPAFPGPCRLSHARTPHSVSRRP